MTKLARTQDDPITTIYPTVTVNDAGVEREVEVEIRPSDLPWPYSHAPDLLGELMALIEATRRVYPTLIATATFFPDSAEASETLREAHNHAARLIRANTPAPPEPTTIDPEAGAALLRILQRAARDQPHSDQAAEAINRAICAAAWIHERTADNPAMRTRAAQIMQALLPPDNYLHDEGGRP